MAPTIARRRVRINVQYNSKIGHQKTMGYRNKFLRSILSVVDESIAHP